MVKVTDVYAGYPLLMQFAEYMCARKGTRDELLQNAKGPGAEMETLTVSPYRTVSIGGHEYNLGLIEGIEPGQEVTALDGGGDLFVIRDGRAHLVTAVDWTEYVDQLEREYREYHNACYQRRHLPALRPMPGWLERLRHESEHRTDCRSAA